MDELLVATLNLRNRQDRWRSRRKLVVAELLDSQPDLVSLQEVYLPIGQARWLRSQINSRISGKSSRPYYLIQKRRQNALRGYFEGIAILSKLPILAHDSVDLGYGGRVALRINVELPSRQTLDFIAVHFHHKAEDREARLEQAMRLTGWLQEKNPVSRQIVAGDFNETPEGPAIQHMKSNFRSAFVEARGYEPVATFPTALVSQSNGWSGCLDYIFISKFAGRVTDAQIFCRKPAPEDPKLYPSDHVGLLAKLQYDSKV
jgi:endonuclease/exonuclease/phosphatase family metal-dependent hydrolase